MVPTWIIVYKNQTDKAKGTAIKVWLDYLLTEGQRIAPSLDYAALPADMQKAAKDQLAKLVIPA